MDLLGVAIPPGVAITVLVLLLLYVLLCLWCSSASGTPRPIRRWNLKVVVITGGTQGLGLALAKKIAAKGAHVAIMARNKEALERASQQVKACFTNEQQKVMALPCDVTDNAQVVRAIDIITKELGVPDVVIANAGISVTGYFAEQTLDQLEWNMKVNYNGSLYLVKAALPAMIQRNQGGHFVFVSSAIAFAPSIGYSTYSAAKCAVRALAESLRQELMLYDISVSIYYPTNIDSEGFAIEEKTKPEETKILEGSAKLNSPDDVAQTLINGLEAGKFYILNDPITYALRAINHSIFVPRQNWLLDLLLTPLLTFINPVFTYFGADKVMLNSRMKRKKKQQ